MNQALIFTLAGVMSAFGNEFAKNSTRPVARFPTRSAIIGLLAGLQGIDRADEESLMNLHNNLIDIEVAIIESGKIFTDYHTITTKGTKLTSRDRKSVV